jgi:hypothetical protein
MNEFDHFVKRELKQKYYIRYADDFVFLSSDKKELVELIPKINIFLSEILKIKIHPNKISISTFYSGIDFLGWVHFPYRRVIRKTTKSRMFNNLEKQIVDLGKIKDGSIKSYLGLLSHGDTYKIKEKIKSF